MIHLKNFSFFRALDRLVKNDRGQVLPFTAIILTGMLGFVAVVVDVGRVEYAQRALQAATDAAAMAGAEALPSASAVTVASNYSALSGSWNAAGNMPNVAMVSGYPKLKCLKTLINLGQACTPPDNANAVQVKQTEVVQLYFAGLFGWKTMTVTASATAAQHGGSPTPYNVALIIDSTASMNIMDSDCGMTQIACALNGVQVLLQSLSPCSASLPQCVFTNGVASSPVDRVALFTFPNQNTATSVIDTSCTTQIPAENANGFYVIPPYGVLSFPYSPASASTSPWAGVPTATAWSFPAAGATSYSPMSVPSIVPGPNGTTAYVNTTYQITNFVSDYRVSDTATMLNSASALAKAVGAVSGCGGMLPPNYEAVYETYYAGVIYAAQSALVAQAAANPGTQNVIIFLSDGDANAPVNNNADSAIPGGASFNYTVLPGANTAGTYPSSVDECGQAVKAAADAASAGTRIYSIAYGSEPTGCSTDTLAGTYPSGLPYQSTEPCTTMASIASAPQYFYSDSNNTANAAVNNCTASQPVKSLNQIFTAIAADLTTARLIPDSTT